MLAVLTGMALPYSIASANSREVTFGQRGGVSEIDSETFSNDTVLPTYDIYIVYKGATASVSNPLAASGVSIKSKGAGVTVVSTAGLADITYHLSGSTPNGFFNITSDKRFNISLEDV
ncbi:MAG: hypothetical protein IKO81_07940, partial [Bacteroidales bacterium]|nr:hypothetical protein [Bacteroidales bacterium]